ncbi:NAD(P)-dependent oxidoreductase [Melittangium boletus]|uniref:Epimerase n=1 Tax=Melittangium boletus DSM 14713 TaxID=1294270 RepID=A0A250IQ78_9BACT|nr:NAD(P)-binding oxidoreductase [Melittangium boletus]ATB33321.1 epimerase [Melittangium boletus DSM 14713]
MVVSSRVVVLGAAGRLGREFVHVGVRLGHTVTAVARNSEKLRAALKVPESSALTFAEADARDVDALASLMKGADAVVNSAGHARDGEAFVDIGRTVVQAAERALGPGGRLWFVGGIGALRVPHTDRLGVDLPGMLEIYQTHRLNHETLRASALDWSMLCPGPLIDTAEGPSLEELRITTDVMPVDIDVSDSPSDALLFSRLRERLPEITIPYMSVAEIAMRHLEKEGPFSRQRLGIAVSR